MKRILALDGGGIRGVFTLQILAKIEELFRRERNEPDLVLADVFDLIAGTSTGAIIAAFLSFEGPSRFLENEFSEPFTLRGLLEAITADGLTIPEAPEAIDSLNHLLKMSESIGLFKKLLSGLKQTSLPNEVGELMRRDVSGLSENERMVLNRFLLEALYPQKCPKKIWRQSVRAIEKLYINHSPEMFAVSPWTKQWKSKYKPEAIANFFRERFAEEDGAPALLGSSRLKTLLLIVMRNGSTGGNWPVSNNPKAMFNLRHWKDGTPNLECNLDFPLWQLLRASTAAPTFFPPEAIMLDNKPHLFMDGGMTPYNNPALIAVLSATLPRYRIEWPTGRELLHVISVGTGLARAKMSGKAASKVNLLDHIRYIAPALIGSVAWEQDYMCRVMGDCVHGAPLDFEIGALEMPNLLNAQEQKFTYARYDRPLDSTDPKIKSFLDEQARRKWRWWKFLKARHSAGKQMELDDLELIPLLQELGAEYAEKHLCKEHLYPRAADFEPCACSVTEKL